MKTIFKPSAQLKRVSHRFYYYFVFIPTIYEVGLHIFLHFINFFTLSSLFLHSLVYCSASFVRNLVSHLIDASPSQSSFWTLLRLLANCNIIIIITVITINITSIILYLLLAHRPQFLLRCYLGRLLGDFYFTHV